LEAYYNRLRGIMTRYAVSLTPAAWDMLTAPVLEASGRESFDIDEAVRSSEQLIMNMAFEHAGGHNTQSVVRAFARNKAQLRPFNA
jgi:hypothetical protein